MFGWAISGRKVDQISTFHITISFHIIQLIFVYSYIWFLCLLVVLKIWFFFSINISALQVHAKVKSYNIFLNSLYEPVFPVSAWDAVFTWSFWCKRGKETVVVKKVHPTRSKTKRGTSSHFVSKRDISASQVSDDLPCGLSSFWASFPLSAGFSSYTTNQHFPQSQMLGYISQPTVIRETFSFRQRL